MVFTYAQILVALSAENMADGHRTDEAQLS